jgi:hypothetical protein
MYAVLPMEAVWRWVGCVSCRLCRQLPVEAVAEQGGPVTVGTPWSCVDTVLPVELCGATGCVSCRGLCSCVHSVAVEAVWKQVGCAAVLPVLETV